MWTKCLEIKWDQYGSNSPGSFSDVKSIYFFHSDEHEVGQGTVELNDPNAAKIQPKTGQKAWQILTSAAQER